MEKLLQPFNIPALECIAGKIANIVKSAKFVGFATLFSASLTVEAQTTFDFEPRHNAFTRVKNCNAYANTNGRDSSVNHYEGIVNNYPTYRLARGGAADSGNIDRLYQSTFMHHNKQLDLSKPFTFSARVKFARCAPAGGALQNYDGQGIAFVLHRYAPEDSVIGLPNNFLGYGWTDAEVVGEMYRDKNSNTIDLFDLKEMGPNAKWQHPPQPLQNSFAVALNTGTDKKLSFLSGSSMIADTSSVDFAFNVNGWHCLNIVWRYKNRNNADSGFVMEVFWNGGIGGKPTVARHYNSISELVPGAVDSVWWGISSVTYDLCSEHIIQFISMQNDTNVFVEFPRFCGYKY